MKKNKAIFIFNDPLLSFSLIEETLIKVISYSAYIFLGASSFVLFFSDIVSLRWFALLVSLFLFDRLFQLGKAEKSLLENKHIEKNVVYSCIPHMLSIFRRTFRRAVATGENPYSIIFEELLKQKEIKQILIRLEISPDEISEKFFEIILENKENTWKKKDIFEALSKLALSAANNAYFTEEKYIYPGNFFSALVIEQPSVLKKIFYLFEINSQDVVSINIFSRKTDFSRFLIYLKRFFHFFNSSQKKIIYPKIINRFWKIFPTPLLDKFGEDLTALVIKERRFGFFSHEKEYKSFINTISSHPNKNIVLAGLPNSGKTTILKHLAFQITKNRVPKILLGKRLVLLKEARFLSENKDLTVFLEKIVQEILIAKNIILVIPDIEQFFEMRLEKGKTLLDILSPLIKRRKISIICEIGNENFKKIIEHHILFFKHFQIIKVEPLNNIEIMKLLIKESVFLEEEFSMIISISAIKKSIELANRYFIHKSVSESALEILRQAIAEAKKQGELLLSKKIVLEVVQRQMKVPIQINNNKKKNNYINLEALIHERFINQSQAVSSIIKTFELLQYSNNSLVSFLFVGPPGVGKSTLAKIIAEIQFGSDRLLRHFDMSQYSEKQSIVGLIGSPDGMRSGLLTDAVSENPYSLFLFTDCEKAHQDILIFFSKIMRMGLIVDNIGRTIHFENAIFIFTTTMCSDFIEKQTKGDSSIIESSSPLKLELNKFFSYEFINGFSNIINFRALTLKEVEEITIKILGELTRIFETTQGLSVSFKFSAVKKIAELGYDPIFGVRSLRSVISEHVRSVLIEKILRKEIGRGNSVIIVYENEHFLFRVVE